MSDRDVFVVSAVRTAIGTFGGSLKDVPPSALATTAIKAAIERAAVPADQVGHVVMGTVIPTEPRDAYLSRVAAMDAGIPKETPAFNVNRLCGSGLQSIVSAAQTLLLGDAEVAIGAGAESMSRGAYLLPGARWGVRMGDAPIVDFVTGALHDPFGRMHMGVTAENVAAKHGITREMQDELAAESHRRAARAVAEGRFAGQIVPVDVPSRKGPVQFTVDEHFRADTSVEQLAKMKPVFKKDGGSVTAGNASGLNDGAAMLVVCDEDRGRELGLAPLAIITATAAVGCEPALMGLGPVHATRKVSKDTTEFDLIELNEAFAAQSLACMQELELDQERVNADGGAIALGHPIGASGARILVHLAHRKPKRGLATLCVGGGMGCAVVVERP